MNKVINILINKTFKSTFFLIKMAGYYKYMKNKMMLEMPKPRKKQWWEKLMEEEFDIFYEKAGEKIK